MPQDYIQRGMRPGYDPGAGSREIQTFGDLYRHMMGEAIGTTPTALPAGAAVSGDPGSMLQALSPFAGLAIGQVFSDKSLRPYVEQQKSNFDKRFPPPKGQMPMSEAMERTPTKMELYDMTFGRGKDTAAASGHTGPYARIGQFTSRPEQPNWVSPEKQPYPERNLSLNEPDVSSVGHEGPYGGHQMMEALRIDSLPHVRIASQFKDAFEKGGYPPSTHNREAAAIYGSGDQSRFGWLEPITPEQHKVINDYLHYRKQQLRLEGPPVFGDTPEGPIKLTDPYNAKGIPPKDITRQPGIPPTYRGYQEGFGKVPGYNIYDLNEDLRDATGEVKHPKGSTVAGSTLQRFGIDPESIPKESSAQPPLAPHWQALDTWGEVAPAWMQQPGQEETFASKLKDLQESTSTVRAKNTNWLEQETTGRIAPEHSKVTQEMTQAKEQGLERPWSGPLQGQEGAASRNFAAYDRPFSKSSTYNLDQGLENAPDISTQKPLGPMDLEQWLKGF